MSTTSYPTTVKPDEAAPNIGGAEEGKESVEEEVAALLPIKAYKNLTSTTRPLLIQTNEEFLNNPMFREHVRNFFGPQRDYSKQFPLMRLPIELRLMIAEYTVTFEEGLQWCWKEEDGKRIGMFKERDWKMKSQVKGQVKGPLNKLCLSRQLQQETSRMWLKVNTLYFTGGLLDEDFDIDDNFDPDHSLERAIDDYDFFSKHPITTGLPALRYIRLTALMFNFNGDVFRKLNQVTANCKDSHSPRVYELGWGMGRRIRANGGNGT